MWWSCSSVEGEWVRGQGDFSVSGRTDSFDVFPSGEECCHGGWKPGFFGICLRAVQLKGMQKNMRKEHRSFSMDYCLVPKVAETWRQYVNVIACIFHIGGDCTKVLWYREKSSLIVTAIQVLPPLVAVWNPHSSPLASLHLLLSERLWLMKTWVRILGWTLGCRNLGCCKK